MKCQLVLQWPASSNSDFDAIIGIEDVLIGNLSKAHEVDGHDAGKGEANIFIFTDEPELAFDEIRKILTRPDFWVDAKVAYREITAGEYTILWPRGMATFRVA